MLFGGSRRWTARFIAGGLFDARLLFVAQKSHGSQYFTQTLTRLSLLLSDVCKPEEHVQEHAREFGYKCKYPRVFFIPSSLLPLRIATRCTKTQLIPRQCTATWSTSKLSVELIPPRRPSKQTRRERSSAL